MKLIDEFDVTDRTKLKLQVGLYHNEERVDVRQYIKLNEEFIATKRGISFNSEWIPRFIEMADKLKDV